MTIYVDDYRGRFRHMVMSHMVADSLDELHAFASRLGLRRDWFQNEGRLPHYDVCQQKREEAFRLGAVSLPIRIDGKANPEWRAVINKARALKVITPASAEGGGT